MSDAVLNHGYVPEEHAPDPLAGRGDPVAPGKLAVWLFLASEIMFFIGLLGTYIVLRSGDPRTFELQGQMLDKWLAGLNTLVLIFSSLTMALSVDAAQKGQRGRLTAMLGVTILCAFGFMAIKTVEYNDKFHHYTLLARGDAPITVTGESGAKLYVVARDNSRKVFNGADFETSKKANWAGYAIPLAGEGETRTGTVPAGAAVASAFEVYQQAGDAPASTDKVVKTAKVDWNGGTYVYDGHLVSKTQTVEGYVAVPQGTRWVALKEKVGQYEAETVGAVVRTADDGRPVVKIDDKQAEEITLSESDLVAVEATKIKDKSWKIDATRRLVPAAETINVHYYTPKADDKLTDKKTHHEYELPFDSINDFTWYGPQKNIFYNCYFALTGVHGLHVVGGIVPLAFLFIHSLRGKIFPAHTEYVGLYWHFVDLVWIFLFPLMYLI